MTTRHAGPIVGLTLVLLAAGCRDTFQPFKAGSGLHFSVFGYLNVAADTQWIRVTPIRQSVFTTPGKLDVTVTLEDMATGATTELHDSLFGFESTRNIKGAAESWEHNFWTDVPIKYGTTYRLSVVGADGKTTTTTVPMPDELREIDVQAKWDGWSGPFAYARLYVRVPAKHVALVEVIHYVSDRAPAKNGWFMDCPLSPEIPRVYRIRQPLGQATTGGDTTAVEISMGLQPGIPGSGCVIGRREVLVASSGSEWPSGVQFSASALGAGEVPSTLDGGVGFVGGVVTRTVPLEGCELTPAVYRSSCVMRYNAESATLEGVVTDSACPGPVEGADVTLTALGESPAVVRRTTADQSGHYRIGALVGGTRYALKVSSDKTWPPDAIAGGSPVYGDFNDTLTARAGTATTYNVAVHRWLSCDPIM